MYFLVYVDDLIVIGNNNIFLHKFLQDLAAKFSVKDLGDLHYFLGIEVLPTPFGLLLTQHKYIRDLLERINMVGSKECVPPLSTSQHLCLNDGCSPTDAYKFCQVINALQYFALTRPNISYAINKLAQKSLVIYQQCSSISQVHHSSWYISKMTPDTQSHSLHRCRLYKQPG